MTMTHDQLHTHGPDELAMLRAECDKWHKAFDRVWEERMRFADRAIELEMKLAIAQQVLRLNKPEALYSNLETMSRLTHEKYVIERRERHHKYKRCLLRSVIAEMNATHFKDLFYGAGSEALADEYNKQVTIHYKWQKRWLALAEKLKEAK